MIMVTSTICSKKLLCSGHKFPFIFNVPYVVSNCIREQDVIVHSASSSRHMQLFGQPYTVKSREIPIQFDKTMIQLLPGFTASRIMKKQQGLQEL